MKVIILWCLLFSSLFVQVFAQETKSSPTSFSQLQEANIRLEEQNKILSKSVSEFRVYLFSSLGFAATFLILFLGVNIYFLKYRYNEDKAILLKTIEDKIEQSKDGLVDEFEKVKKAQRKEIPSIIDGKTKGLEKENIYRRIDIQELKIKLEETPSNKLSKYTQLVKDYLSLGWDMQLADSLKAIIDLLEDGALYDSSEHPEVFKLLSELPSEFDSQATKIKRLIIQ